MKGHPGGMEHSLNMLTLSQLLPGSSILDMGAGAGETVRLFRNREYKVRGMDLKPQSEEVEQGDFLQSGFSEELFDGIISQCAFFVSGNVQKALLEACRMLKPGGILMLSDVCPKGQDLGRQAEEAGFLVLYAEDLTTQWKEYYIEAIWRGTADCVPCQVKYNYQMVICRKKE
ncbi:MAG: class I SAM-dependent methyltransferase [Lachnospiraceae bacterium]|nr:class I SAM-dependent methyltransferase [Lachnospiraceae bacterium]